MEEASLTLAHSYARRASQETQKARLTLAATEHESAAGEFAKAAGDTVDAEALRILRLLEDHHRKLAQIIKTKDILAKAASEAKPASNEEQAPRESEAVSPTSPPSATVQSPPQPHKPSMAVINQCPRESSPALAKDIASRRGIPQAQQRRVQTGGPSLSDQRAGGRMASTPRLLSPEAKSRRPVHATQQEHSRPISTISHVPPNAFQQDVQRKSAANDEGFAKFYSNLTSGPLSKLSSMLAFAGLPLTAEEETLAQSKIEKTSARASNDPDVNKLFSQAALHAIEEQQRNQGFSGNAFGPGESFYVIPTSGGTVSYADILSRAQQDAQRHHYQASEGLDDFVDARETQAPRSPRHSRVQGRAPSSVREEELQIENATLKQVLDQMSHRLAAFESHAQDASMAALTQSMASIRAGPTGSPASDETVRALQEQLAREADERQRLAAENLRQKQVITKYRSHWETLKQGARGKMARREQEGKSEKSERSGSAG